MEFIYSTEIFIPPAQIIALLLISTPTHLLCNIKLALLGNYPFDLYWAYNFNRAFSRNGTISYLKNTSNAQLRCCGPPQNVLLIRQNTLADCAFSSARALPAVSVAGLSLNGVCIFEIASISGSLSFY
jgi:hypothetical protein